MLQTIERDNLMTDLERYLRARPWWNSRFMWGGDVTKALIRDAIWRSRFTSKDILALPEDSLA